MNNPQRLNRIQIIEELRSLMKPMDFLIATRHYTTAELRGLMTTLQSPRKDHKKPVRTSR